MSSVGHTFSRITERFLETRRAAQAAERARIELVVASNAVVRDYIRQIIATTPQVEVFMFGQSGDPKARQEALTHKEFLYGIPEPKRDLSTFVHLSTVGGWILRDAFLTITASQDMTDGSTAQEPPHPVTRTHDLLLTQDSQFYHVLNHSASSPQSTVGVLGFGYPTNRAFPVIAGSTQELYDFFKLPSNNEESRAHLANILHEQTLTAR